MKKYLLTLLCLGVLAFNAAAQLRTVRGKVTGAEDGLSIPGASVKIKGTTQGVVTDIDGNYSISVGSNATLEFSFLGYVTQEIAVGDRTVINVSLRIEPRTLSEVVVTGYGTERKVDVSGAVSQVKAKDIEDMPVTSFEKAMQGRMAGVQVVNQNGIPGGGVNVRIRGIGSINAGNSPLYIIDGVQVTGGDISRSLTSSNTLAGLNNDDIESISVLKDASAAAIYGAQAANGVIVITTNKGRAGKTKIDLTYQTGVNSFMRMVPVTTGPEFLQVMLEGRRNVVANAGLDPDTHPVSTTDIATAYGYGFTPASFASAPTYSWIKEGTRNGIDRNLDLSATGGNDNTTFYISGTYQKTDGQFIRSDFTKGGLRINLDHKANDRLKFDTKLNLSSFVQNGLDASNGGGSIFLSAITIPSIQPIYNPDGSYAEPVLGTRPDNVIKTANLDTRKGVTNQILGSISGTYTILDGLNFKSSWNLDFTDINEDRYIHPLTAAGSAFGGQANALNTRQVNWSTDQVLSYDRNINDIHSIGAIGGFTYRNVVSTTITAVGRGFPNELFTKLQNAATPFSVSGNYTTYRIAGYFGKVNYGFRDKYLASVTARYDGSSRFGANKRYGFFPSASVAWRISQEDFLKESNTISDLKLRVSHGITGNSSIDNFASRGLFGGTGSYNGLGGINPTQLGNDELSWEESHSTNLGLDFGFFNQRLSGTIDLFRRDSKNLLLEKPIPSTSGYTSINENIGRVRNQGVEFELFSENLVGNFKWSTGLNLTYLTNKVLEVNPGQDRIGTTVFVGKSIGSIYVVEYAGVNVATGRSFYYDSNNNPTYIPLESSDRSLDARRIIGSTFIPFYGGLTNEFSFKGFDLSFLVQGSFGNTVINNNTFFAERAGVAVTNYTQRAYTRRWLKPGDVTDWPRMYANVEPQHRGMNQFSSRNYERADYIRLKNVNLAYTFQNSWINKIGMRSARVFVEGVNLWTKTGYSGYDPEFTGADLGVYPQPRTITAGVKVGL